jgi:uncharacterized protein YndB with AHSA1/START domain
MNTVIKEYRTDSAWRIIKASPQTIYEALLDPQAVAQWRPPQGMTCQIYKFEPRPGGAFRMAFSYTDTDQPGQGKTEPHVDMFHGKFDELVPNKRVVERVQFETKDPAFGGTMTITTLLTPTDDGTKVAIVADNVPPGIRPEDHEKGMNSTLENLARFTEQAT